MPRADFDASFCKVAQHDFKIRRTDSTVTVSAPLQISASAPAIRTVTATLPERTGRKGVTSANWTCCCSCAMVTSRFSHEMVCLLIASSCDTVRSTHHLPWRCILADPERCRSTHRYRGRRTWRCRRAWRSLHRCSPLSAMP